MMLKQRLIGMVVLLGTVVGCTSEAFAQNSVAPAAATAEEVEPRIIGHTGVTLLGVSGTMSRFFSSEQLMAGTYTVQVDAHRFILSKVALRFGVVGTDAFGAADDDDDDDDSSTSTSTTALEAIGGALYYFTPESIWSFYAGGEYRARLTSRFSGDAGSAGAIAGLQGALSARASFFVEGGYGLRLRRGDEGELQTRIVGLAGVRFRF
jgi:hypothetical protein